MEELQMSNQVKFFSASELADLKDSNDVVELSKALSRAEVLINDSEDEIALIKEDMVSLDELDLSGLDDDEIKEVENALALINAESDDDLKQAEKTLNWNKTVKKELKKALRTVSHEKKENLIKNLSKKGKRGRKGKK